MKFSILNKRMLENDDIRKIVDRIPNYASIFTLDQQRNFDIRFNISTSLILKDYDSVANQGTVYYLPATSSVSGKIDWDYYDVHFHGNTATLNKTASFISSIIGKLKAIL